MSSSAAARLRSEHNAIIDRSRGRLPLHCPASHGSTLVRRARGSAAGPRTRGAMGCWSGGGLQLVLLEAIGTRKALIVVVDESQHPVRQVVGRPERSATQHLSRENAEP